MNEIIVNSFRCPDGTVLTSRHRHDYVTHIDACGEIYVIDGGLDYLRRSLHHGDFVPTDLSLYSDDTHEKKRNAFAWGTYGKNGNEPLKYVLLKDMSEGHIKAILETQHHLRRCIKQMFEDELVFRGESNDTQNS